MNFFNQAGGQEAAIAAFVVLEPSLERAAVEVIQRAICCISATFTV